MNGEEQQPGGRLGQLRERLAQHLDEGDRRETVKDRKDGHSSQLIRMGVMQVRSVFEEISPFLDAEKALVENETTKHLVDLPIAHKNGSEVQMIIEENVSAHSVRVGLSEQSYLIKYVLNPDRYPVRYYGDSRRTPGPREVFSLIGSLFEIAHYQNLLSPNEDPSPGIDTVDSAIRALQNLRGRLGEFSEEERVEFGPRIEAELQQYYVMGAILKMESFEEKVINGRKGDQERAQAENGK